MSGLQGSPAFEYERSSGPTEEEMDSARAMIRGSKEKEKEEDKLENKAVEGKEALMRELDERGSEEPLGERVAKKLAFKDVDSPLYDEDKPAWLRAMEEQLAINSELMRTMQRKIETLSVNQGTNTFGDFKGYGPNRLYDPTGNNVRRDPFTPRGISTVLDRDEYGRSYSNEGRDKDETLSRGVGSDKVTPYGGHPSELINFLAELRLTFSLAPQRYQDERVKVSFTLKSLTGRAALWRNAFLVKPAEEQPIFMDNFEFLVSALTNTFGASDLIQQAVRDMRALRQVTSANKYLTDFQVLALQSGYKEDRALIDLAREGLKETIKDELARDRTVPGTSFNEWMRYVIELDNRLFARQVEKVNALKAAGGNYSNTRTNGYQQPARPILNANAPQTQQFAGAKGRMGNSAGRPTQQQQNTYVGGPRAKLDPAILKQRREEGLCLYCGDSNHLVVNCTKTNPNNNYKPASPVGGKNYGTGANAVGAVKGRRGRVVDFENIWVDMEVEHGDVKIKAALVMPGTKEKVEVVCLMDNGATSNLISPGSSLLNKLEVQDYPYTRPLMMIDGTVSDFKITQYVDIDIVIHPAFGSLSVRFDLIPVDGYEILLGLNFFINYQVMMDFGNKRFRLDPNTRDFKKVNGGNDAVRVRYTAPVEVSTAEYADEFRSMVEDDDEQEETAELEAAVPKEYHEFIDVFRKSHYNSLPPNRDYDMPITLREGAIPIKGNVYPLSASADKWLKEWIDKSLANGQIETSNHFFGSPVFLVAKKVPGEFRMVTDFRKLNDVTVKNAYPLPRINTLLERLRSATIFSKFDMPTSYQLLRIKPGDEKWTTILTRYGSFQSKVVREGLSNAGACFQYFLNDIFHPLLDRGVIIYIDDILVYSTNKEEHEATCKEVFKILKKHSLYLKAAKCDFNKDKIGFLGFVVRNGEVSMEEGKLQAVRDWPAPKTVKEVQKFLGFANFYRRFIYGFAGVTKSLTALTRKSRPWQWGEEESNAFDKLKTAFTSAPILKQFDEERVCFLETDASDFAIAGVLSQRFDGHPGDTGFDGDIRPIGFYSCRLNPIGEVNYTVHDKELLAIIRCLKEWKHLLIGSPYPIVIITDHRNLEYFNKRRELSSRQARWAQFLADYNIEIRFRPGKEGGKPDSLSRRADYQPTSDKKFQEWNEANHTTLLSPTIFTEGVKVRRGVVPPEDEYRGFTGDTRSEDMERWGFDEKDIGGGMAVGKLPIGNDRSNYGWTTRGTASFLTYKGKIVVPNNEFSKYTIVSARHDSILAGHVGRDKTLDLVWRDYHWPSARAYVYKYVATCEDCQRNKAMRHKPYGMLKPISVPSRPWKDISYDLIEGLPESQGFTDILVVVDRHTKMAHFILTDNRLTAERLARTLLDEIFMRYGLPDRIVSDRGSEFASKLWKEVLRRLSVARDLSTAFHPQTDGQTERINQTLEHFIRNYCNYQQDNWSNLLSMAEFSYNNSRHSATGVSPFFALYGYNPRFEVQGPFANTESTSGTSMANTWQSHWKFIQEQQIEAQKSTAYYYNRHRSSPPDYKVGDMVWVDAKNIKTVRPSKKLDMKRIGPLKIVEKISSHAYRLKLPKGLYVHDVFSVELLEEFRHNDIAYRPTPPGPIVESPEEDIFEVDEVVDSRMFRGHLQYRLQWRGYNGLEKYTWEKFDKDMNVEVLREEFHARYPEKPGAEAKIDINGHVRWLTPTKIGDKPTGPKASANEANQNKIKITSKVTQESIATDKPRKTSGPAKRKGTPPIKEKGIGSASPIPRLAPPIPPFSPIPQPAPPIATSRGRRHEPPQQTILHRLRPNRLRQ